MQYRRSDVAGGSYFFTVNLLNRQQTLLIDHVDLLRDIIRKVKYAHPFHIDAMVILPDHLHAIWTLSEDDNDFSTRWSLIKSGFSRGITKGEFINVSRQSKGERGIWQRRFWEHLIRDDNDYARHIDYIHYNPVKHGYVEQASTWVNSSIHQYIQQGIIDNAWGVNMPFDDTGFGEESH